MTRHAWIGIALLFAVAVSSSQKLFAQDIKPLAPLPTAQQLAWHGMEFIAFAHFGINTFYGTEWGDGTEDPARFDPTEFDARQWARAVKNAGAKMIILTCKHHDGFCLWPSEFTEHSVKNSAWKNGGGDVVREVSDACREYGLKFGVYLSPWDRNHPEYGNSPVYNEYVVNQLAELLSNYGPIAEVWFDGANGEGPNGKRQEYDWMAYYKTIRRLQPNAVIAIVGPDVRWVGNESGVAAETEWSPQIVSEQGLNDPRIKYTPTLAKGSPRYIADAKKQRDDVAFAHLESAPDPSAKNVPMIWYPSETDVSIRPGWFYHEDQDDKVKSLEHLIDIYYKSIGRGTVLLLNLPPDPRGRIHENDAGRLRELRAYLDDTFKRNLAETAEVTVDSAMEGCSALSLTDNDPDTIWAAAEESETALITLEWDEPIVCDMAMLQEPVQLGQRVAGFTVEARLAGEWTIIRYGATVGTKRMLRFPEVETDGIRIQIEKSRAHPALHSIGVYKQAFHTE